MKLKTAILSTILLAGCASTPQRPASIERGDYAMTREYVTRLIQHEMKKNSVEGLSIALVDDQRIVWSEGFGYADKAQKIPATAGTIYRVGSISKLFTDTAAMQLAEQGKLDIDQPLRKYIPDFSIKSHFADQTEITPRQLMTHHSGLPRDRLKGFMTSNPAPFADLVNDLRDEYTAYPPNQIFAYSNVGVTLLGIVIQNQGGKPFAAFMRQSLLDPLGMKDSSFETGLSPSGRMARAYRGLDAVDEPALRDVPAGGLNSSVADLSRFISMVFADGKSGKQTIIEPTTLAEMLRPQNTSVLLDFNFHTGLGWMLSTLGSSTIQNGGVVAHHAGATVNYHGQLYILPEYKLGVVVLSNSSTAGQVVDHVATEALGLALEAKAGIRQPEHHKIQPDNKPLSNETVQEYAGNYTTMAGFAKLSACGKGLCADVADHRFDLVRGADGLFRLDYSLLGIFHLDLGALGEAGISLRTVDNRNLLVAQVDKQQMLVGQRIDPPTHVESWRAYLGEYEIADLGTDHKFFERAKLIEEQGFLFAEITAAGFPPLKKVLKPLSDTEGILLGALNDGGETMRVVQQDGEARLWYLGYQFRKIKR